MFKIEKLALNDIKIFIQDIIHHFVYTVVIVGISSIIMYFLLVNVVKQQVASILTLPPTKTSRVIVVPETKVNGDNYGDSYVERGSPYDNRTIGSNSADVIFHGARNKKRIALTFDAEMTDTMKANLLTGRVKSSYDKRIIDTLIATNTKATLFLTGMWIELYPEVTQQLSQNYLFELASHSYTDSSYSGFCYGLGQLPNTLKIEDIGATEKLLREHAGIDNRLFRFPGGCYTPDDVKLVNQANDIVVHWDVIGADGFNTNTNQIIHNVVDNTQNGSIIILHLNGKPTAPETANALPEIIKQLKAKGFEFVKINELLNLPQESKG
ncbi:MAG TPA: polysaccharide deacetylase family protein [Candidatus Sulfotelmatobacter sp.]|nr:polysaccharide deacetylase family protein [Candidatus Sulfotelmatobacter sp.]